MTTVNEGKYCMSCQKTVVDFSLMSDNEILLHISKARSNVCGRFMPEQLNRGINIIDKEKRSSWKYAWKVMLAALLISAEGNAQTKLLQGKIKISHNPNTLQPELKEPGKTVKEPVVTVVDADNGTPLQSASVIIKGTNTGVVTDSNGNFIVIPPMKTNKTIIVSSVGYESRILNIDELLHQEESPVIKLRTTSEMLGDIEVIAYPSKHLQGMLGGLFIVKRSSLFEKMKDTLVTSFAKNPLRIFPNPVRNGGIINIQFAINSPGVYMLSIVNSAGQIITSQTIPVQQKDQVKQLFIDNSYLTGTYFIRLENVSNKNIYQNKFLVK